MLWNQRTFGLQAECFTALVLLPQKLGHHCPLFLQCSATKNQISSRPHAYIQHHRLPVMPDRPDIWAESHAEGGRQRDSQTKTERVGETRESVGSGPCTLSIQSGKWERQEEGRWDKETRDTFAIWSGTINSARIISCWICDGSQTVWICYRSAPLLFSVGVDISSSVRRPRVVIWGLFIFIWPTERQETERESDNNGARERERPEREREAERGRKEETERPSGSNLLLAYKNTLMTGRPCACVCACVCMCVCHLSASPEEWNAGRLKLVWGKVTAVEKKNKSDQTRGKKRRVIFSIPRSAVWPKIVCVLKDEPPPPLLSQWKQALTLTSLYPPAAFRQKAKT